MPRLVLTADRHYRGTLPGTSAVWFGGEARDVPEETASYLLDSFPGMFSRVDALPVVAAVSADIEAPPVDRMMRAPARRKGGR